MTGLEPVNREQKRAWHRSPVYGSAVLGPAQVDTLAFVVRFTQGGRAPVFTLRTMAAMIGRPRSSIADALGRLRALGYIGASARIGRIGGYRLWIPRRVRRAILDRGKAALARARILARFWREDPDRGADVGDADAADRTVDRSGPEDPPEASPAPPSSPVGETFGQRMRRYGLGDWIDERRHGR